MTSAELVDDLGALERHREPWDRLAVELAQPYCAPAWMLASWRHAVSGTAVLRSVAVWDGGELVGLAPYFAQIGRAGLAEYRIMGAGGAHRIAPLALPGREQEVAGAIAQTIAAATPRPSSFLLEGVDLASHWPALVRAAWPGALRPRLRSGYVLSAPTLSLEDRDYERWFAERSANFRQQMRRKGRRLAARGGRIRLASGDAEVRSDLEAMVRLHHLRWASRGGSGVMSAGVEAALREAVPQLCAGERARLWTIEADGEPVCVQLFVAAGGRIVYWGGGFDPAWEDVHPAQLAILAAVEDAFSRGERQLDFGGGDQPYKWRFANRDEPVAWISLFPRNRRYPLTRLQLLPKESRQAVRSQARRLPPFWQDRLRRLTRR
ncbi:MAG TPA: GNAT family N-acetyltransferase [Solirubrobacteraceae bacterium]|nr:GNAT family N-acetyltransferase [Solirubrobacteraceae bacterium]